LRRKALTLFCCIILSLLLPLTVNSEDGFTLTLSYGSSALPVEIYRVAGIDFSLAGAFKDLPVNITNVKSNEEWAVISDTLESYIIADSIKADYTVSTDTDGNAIISGLAEGLYLTMPCKTEDEDKTVLYDGFITAVTEDMTVYPKSSSEDKPDISELKIIKQWKDEGYRSKRPDKITVDLFCDSKLYDTVELTEENNWSYTLKISDKDKGEWTVVERNTGKYTVTVKKNEESIILTNSYKEPGTPPKAPQTGDPLVTGPYIVSFALSGLCIIVIAATKGGKKA